MQQFERFEHYYSINFSKTGMDDPRKTLRFYDACFNWCLSENKEIRVLDYGAGLGNLMYWLKQKGFTYVYGIDVSKDNVTWLLR
jgi:2-polyprenyl-3-methyl-5-hydroxy-6-metoxy-1,4-benzoquinol methylase